MNCLLLEGSPADRDKLAHLLLPIGVKAIIVSTKAEALAIIDKDSQIISAIIDVDSHEIDGLELAKELKGNPKTRNIKVIVNSTQTGRDFVVGLVELGIHGYLRKPIDQEKASQKLTELLIKGTPLEREKRDHIRVSPDPGELLRMHFRLPGLTVLIAGKILNISMGGVALELFNYPEQNPLPPGSRIPKLQFDLGTNSLSPSGNVVIFKENIMAIRFGPLSTKDRESLARYIYKRLSAPAAYSDRD